MTSLIFRNCRAINGSNYTELSDTHLEQMKATATLGFGPEYTTSEHFLEQCGDGDMADAIVELWDVVASDKPDHVVYECWVYLCDTATVFHAGTIKTAGAAMCQWSFDDHSGDGSNGELCKSLQNAFDAQRMAQKTLNAK
jgi:hypothetical protein